MPLSACGVITTRPEARYKASSQSSDEVLVLGEDLDTLEAAVDQIRMIVGKCAHLYCTSMGSQSVKILLNIKFQIHNYI